MTVSREDIEVAAEEGQRAWATPTVHKLSAGSAEDGNGPETDASFNPS